jgi:hypothetical protein
MNSKTFSLNILQWADVLHRLNEIQRSGTDSVGILLRLINKNIPDLDDRIKKYNNNGGVLPVVNIKVLGKKQIDSILGIIMTLGVEVYEPLCC